MSLAERLRGKRVGVALSSAFFGFYGHTGFLLGLRRAGIEPTLLSGTSAGAMSAAFGAAGALDTLREVLGTLQRKHFWDPVLPFGRPPGLLRGRRFLELLEAHLPVRDFEDCLTPLLTVSTNISRRARHVDTSGPIAPAVLASCALPLLFRPVERGGELHVDGGLLDKVPVRAMIEAAELDALLIHLLPSSGLTRPVARDPWRFMDQALDWVREDAWRQQAALAEARGIEVHVVTTRPPRLNPWRLSRGREAIEVSEREAYAALSSG